MSAPTVCAVMLTADRPEMARRAIECFRAQTYMNKRLQIYDTGKGPRPELMDRSECYAYDNSEPLTSTSVGQLRNAINSLNDSDIICHWDDDDWSHPNRIAEQVALLQSSGAEAVGYREMLFWRDSQKAYAFGDEHAGEAWLYSNTDPRYCLGTSLCYWRKTWERKPFPATSQGEDTRWLSGLKSVGVSSLSALATPAMIARIHAGNTSNAYRPAEMERASEWRRVPSFDQYCRKAMEL